MTAHRNTLARRWPRTSCRVALLSVVIGLAACDHDPPAGPKSGRANSDVAADGWTNVVPANLKMVPPDYVTGPTAGADQVGALLVGTPVIRTYKLTNAWFGENRDNATLLAMGKVLGTDYFVHPLTDLASGIPAGTTVALMTSNGAGNTLASAQQSAPAAQASLATFLSTGGVIIVDMGDNDALGGFHAPGATGTPTLIFPNPPDNATFTTAAAGGDGILGTSDDHPIVLGPDGLPGTADDLTNSNIDVCCFVAHGNLVDGLTLPAGATVLATAVFNGVVRPILAEYCYQGGRVILDTFTKEFSGQQPGGTGPTYFMRNLFSYAMSPAAQCNRAPTASAGGPYTGNEGSAVSFNGSASSDPDGDALSYSWNFGDPNAAGGGTATGATPTHTYKENGSYTVTLTVNDGRGGSDSKTATVNVANVAPSLGALSVPAAPVALQTGGTSVAISAAFTDPGTLDTHVGSLSCDGGSAGSVSAVASNGSGSSSGNCTFSAAGVYTVSMTVTDDDGGSDTKTAASYIVVYDASGGFVTGGGWIDSPTGAFAADPSQTGKATFGFVAKYQKGATTPSGSTEFQFHAGSLDFHSDAYDWLVIAGARAQYKGIGSIVGRPGSVRFLITAIDGDVAGGGGVDKFRIKIWDAVTDALVYDNQVGQLEDSPAATALGGGNISIKSK